MHLLEPLVPGSQNPTRDPSPATSLEGNCYPNSIETMVLLRVSRQGKRQPPHCTSTESSSPQTAEQSKSPAPGAFSNAQSGTLCPLTAMCCLFYPASHPHNFLASYCRERLRRYAYQSARSGCFAFGTTSPAAEGHILKWQPTCLMNTNRRTECEAFTIYGIWSLQ
jgi:hypothetical protein